MAYPSKTTIVAISTLRVKIKCQARNLFLCDVERTVADCFAVLQMKM